MSRDVRWNALLELVGKQGRVDVDDAARTLDVSAATIRRDLDQLAEQQLLTRTRGGAVAHGVSYELALRYKTGRNAPEKQAIGRAGAELVAVGEVVGLTGGTTITEVARSLAVRPDLVGDGASGSSGQPTLTVVTNARVYLFELAPASSEVAYTVRFRYPGAVVADAAPSAPVDGRYRVSGARELRPSRIGDDGQHTYIQWPSDRALPAVYALNEAGQETLVNGAMRDDMFVIDSVQPRLVFRIDQHIARADRVDPERAR